MLLYQKPIREIVVGDAFEVTVLEKHWVKGYTCPIENALMDRFGVGKHDVLVIHREAEVKRKFLRHDGKALVVAFDCGQPFPGDTVVRFTCDGEW